MRKVFYEGETHRIQLIAAAESKGERLHEDALTVDGSYLIFSPTTPEDINLCPTYEELENQNTFTVRSGRRRDTIMVNPIVVRIVAERILSGGINPKTGEVYVQDDIMNLDYRQAVEDYILMNMEGT